MLSVGITGQSGFVGTNLYNKLCQHPEKYKLIPFDDSFFEQEQRLCSFVRHCDIIVHLAAVMRCKKEGEIYRTNMRLVNKLITSLDETGSRPSLMFSSSIQESNGSEYGKSKKEGGELLQRWAEKHEVGFSRLVFPNIFGPLAKPNSSSFIATFCYKLTHGEEPQIFVDNIVPLIFIDDLVKEIMKIFEFMQQYKYISTFKISPTFHVKVTDVLSVLKGFKIVFLDNGIEPLLNSDLEKSLFITFKSYIDNK